VVGGAAAAMVVVAGITAGSASAATGTGNDPANLSPNPVLASSSTGYSVQEGGTSPARVAVTDHVAAAWAYRVTESSTTTRVREPRAAVTAGAAYVWASDVKAPATASVQVTVSWYNSAGGFLSFSTGTTGGGFSQTAWKRAQATLTAPAGAVQGETVVNVLSRDEDGVRVRDAARRDTPRRPHPDTLPDTLPDTHTHAHA
jgi:hypothetical protein